MKAEALRALQQSINKWADIVAGKAGDGGTRTCPLCVNYYQHHCGLCPVMLETGLPFCRGTPYIEWAEYQGDKGGIANTICDREVDFVSVVFDDQSYKLAQAELDFLRSLLPVAIQDNDK